MGGAWDHKHFVNSQNFQKVQQPKILNQMLHDFEAFLITLAHVTFVWPKSDHEWEKI